ncbi:hypothetical protein CBS63078_81 [Aspergillus niger]|nr:hypothetical protein CBS115989_6190 [Aspergillus niger]KAI2820587.1 hypothetical protein CBS133816_9744 [Aspergillus niger]KAI2846540.1 hypothetical protein CBS11350_3573 [Aspergillus niger]KAI2848108.1 hypothetical protein CBS11232_6964 [Aspergillus niger]KAI2866377.1 hypothetical protein CBS12448_1101 [Aspergillus niger]
MEKLVRTLVPITLHTHTEYFPNPIPRSASGSILWSQLSPAKWSTSSSSNSSILSFKSSITTITTSNYFTLPPT